MRSLRYTWRLITAFVAKFKFLLLVGLGIGIFGFGLINRIFPALTAGNVERVGLTGRVRVENLPSEILTLISRGLTNLDEAGVPQADIAKSWEVTGDGKTWTFHLEENLRWQDDKKLTSADIKYPFSDVTIETPDEGTIVFKLQSPFSPFATVVSRPVFKKGLLGVGEWEVPRGGLRLVGQFVESLTLVNSEGERKVFKFYPTEERTKLALKLGSVDRIENIFNPKPFDSWRNIEIA